MKKVQVIINVSGIWNMEFDEENWKNTDMQQMIESFFINQVATKGLGLFDVQYSVKDVEEEE